MRKTLVVSAALLVLAGCAAAQDNILQDLHLQIHGNLVEGVLYGSGNNYLDADTTDGTGLWDEGSLSVTSTINDHFRVGAQATSWLLGGLGRQNIELDWAYADYKFNSWFGIRAGQVKTPFGLYNEVQDVDAVIPWAFLPQSMYPVDYRSFTLSQQGGVLYGDLPLGKRGGTISWSAFGGRREERRNEGLVLTLASMGIALNNMAGTIGGADVRWKPVDGLLFGAAYSDTDLYAPHGTFGTIVGPIPFPVSESDQQEQIYSQFEKGKWNLSAEYRRTPIRSAYGPEPAVTDIVHSWYVMASYRATNKLTLGSYYNDEQLIPPGGGGDNPSNYLKDVTVSSRYDFNRLFYAKLEGHYMDGNAVGFYAQVKPQGLQKVTRLLAARIGFTF